MSNNQQSVWRESSHEKFPGNVDEMISFLMAKGFELEDLDRDKLAGVVCKLNQQEKLDAKDIELMHNLVDLGDTCGCDSDHRIRNMADDGMKIGYAKY